MPQASAELVSNEEIIQAQKRIAPLLVHLDDLSRLLDSSSNPDIRLPKHYESTDRASLVELVSQTKEVMTHIYERIPVFLTQKQESPVMAPDDRRILARVAEFLKYLPPFSRAFGINLSVDQVTTVHNAQGDASDILKGQTPSSFVVAHAVEAKTSESFVPSVPCKELHPSADSLQNRHHWNLKSQVENDDEADNDSETATTTETDSDDISVVVPDYEDEELNLIPADSLDCRDYVAKPVPLPVSPLPLSNTHDVSVLLDSDDDSDEEIRLPLSEAAAASISRAAEEQIRAKALARKAADLTMRTSGILRPARADIFTHEALKLASEAQKGISNGSILPVAGPEAPLTGHDFETLVKPRAWLNDAIVDASLAWLDRFANLRSGASGYPKSENRSVLIMGSFFFSSLVKNGGKNTERALRRKGVTPASFAKMETVLVPVCKNSHWTLLVIQPLAKKVTHMDSMNVRGSPSMIMTVRDWLMNLLGDKYIDEEWKRVSIEAPVQDNGYDCGVFTILNAVSIVLGCEPGSVYQAHEMRGHRWSIAAMLINGGFEGVFDLAEL